MSTIFQWINGGLLGSLVTLCIGLYIDYRRQEKKKSLYISEQRLHHTYSPIYFYTTLNFQYAEEIFEDLSEIQKKINKSGPDADVSKQYNSIESSLKNLQIYTDKIVESLVNNFSYLKTDDELCIIQYLTLCQRIQNISLPLPPSQVRINSLVTVFKGLCFILNIVKSRFNVTSHEARVDLNIISFSESVEKLRSDIAEYSMNESKYKI
ncbi:MAG: hypothetical protein HYX60_04420 [Legionella longbeachae]|nr:hypothetical protein [Legionella longbeachae]